MSRFPTVMISLLLASGGLSACGVVDGLGNGHLSDALELVPADATAVRFADRRAMAERLGVDDADVERYADAVIEEEVMAVTDFFTSLIAMTEGGAAFTDLDVEWAVTALGLDQQQHLTAYKMDDDLDLDEVGDDLVDAGFEEDELSGHRHFTIDPEALPGSLAGDRYPADVMADVTVVPDEHLMLVGGEDLVDVYEDTSDSMADSGDLDETVDDDDAEFAQLLVDPCAEIDGEELPRPEATGFSISADDAETSSVFAFADDDQAEADLAARETYLDEEVADVADWEIERDGSLVKMEYEYEEPRMASQAALTMDGFNRCQPS